ncbi:glycosyltransferase family 2 protein, partial [Chloroflexota bacterium]
SANKLKIKEVPINVAYDVQGSTKNPLSHGLGILTGIIQLASEKRPLIFFGFTGLILIVAGIYSGIRLIHIYDQSGNISLGYGILVIVLIVSGIMLISAGVTLNAIRRLLNKYRFG